MTPGNSRSSWVLQGAAWVVLAGVLLGVSSLAYGWTTRDSGSAAYIGAIILEGGAPYRDAWNVKGPGVDFAYALAIALFGQNPVAVRLLDLLWQIATALVLAHLCGRFYQSSSPGQDASAGVIAGIAYLLAYFANDFWSWTEPDGFLSLPLTLALWMALRAREEYRFLFWMLAGAGTGVAVLFKLPYGVFGVVLLAAGIVTPGKSTDRWMRRPAALALGFALPLLLVGLYLFRKHALADYLAAQFLLAPEFTGLLRAQTSRAMIFKSVWRAAMVPLFLMAAAWLASLAVSREPNHRTRWPALLAVAWIAAAALTLVVHGAYLEYHYLPFTAPLALLSAEPLHRLFSVARANRPAARVALGLAALALFAPARKLMVHDGFAWAVLAGKPVSEGWKPLGTYLREHTSAQERIFVWGDAPVIYLYADRKSSSRFIHTYFLQTPWRRVNYRPVFLSEFTAHLPRYFVLIIDSANPEELRWKPGREGLEQFPAVQKILAEEYEIDRTETGYILYRRKNPAAGRVLLAPGQAWRPA